MGRRLVVRPDGTTGGLGSDRADAAVADDVRGLLAAGRTATLTYGPHGERRGEGMRVFVASYAPKPRMLVFGAIDFAAAVARQGAFLGYQVTVCDARPVFATAARFPDAHEVVVSWPHKYLAKQVEAGLVDERTVICLLTHDPKFDVPLLEVALRLPEDQRPACYRLRFRGSGATETLLLLREVGESFLNFQVSAKREATRESRLAELNLVDSTGPDNTNWRKVIAKYAPDTAVGPTPGMIEAGRRRVVERRRRMRGRGSGGRL